MKLIDLLVQELPKRGGWPVGAAHAWADPDGEIRFRGVGVSYDFYHAIAQVDKLARVPGFFHENTWRYIITRDQYDAALAAAQQPVWNGEGLPPVGCECEFFDCEKWLRVTMMYGGSQLVVLFDHDNQIERTFSTSRIDGKFRPIRSEADKKRDEFVKQIMSWMHYAGEAEVALIYDAIAAGKIPGVKLEDAQ